MGEWREGNASLCGMDACSLRLSCGIDCVGRCSQTCRAMGKVVDSKATAQARLTVEFTAFFLSIPFSAVL